MSSSDGSLMSNDMEASGFVLRDLTMFYTHTTVFLFFFYLFYSAHLSTISRHYNGTADVLWKMKKA